MKTIYTILLLLFFLNVKAQLERPEVFLSQYEMTAVGGQPYDEFYWFNTASANLTKSVSFTGGTYRFDLSAYAKAGAAQVGLYIDGTLKGTITVNTPVDLINIFSLPTLSIAAGSHTVKIQINNFSGSIHCRVGLLYFTKSTLTVPYVYPTLSAKSLPASGEYLTKEDFGGGHLRGFNLSGIGHSASSLNSMKATGANIGRCFVEGQFTGDVFSLASGELTKLDSSVARAAQRSYYLVPSLYMDPGQSFLWGTSASAVAKRKSVASMWKFLANRYKLNTWVGAYDTWNEPRSNFNYAEVIRWQTDIVDSIRSVDANHVIALECINNNMWAMMLPLGYTNIIYSPHGYSTLKITHQGIDHFLKVSPADDTVRNKYPTTTSTVNLNAPWNITNLSAQHDPVRIMTNRFHVPIFIGEFSCVNWAPVSSTSGKWTSTEWINDNITLLEAEGWSWVYHAWREFEAWDAEIPSQYYIDQGFTYSEGAPFNSDTKPAGWASQRTSSAPTITMLTGWFALNGTTTDSFCDTLPKKRKKQIYALNILSHE